MFKFIINFHLKHIFCVESFCLIKSHNILKSPSQSLSSYNKNAKAHFHNFIELYKSDIESPSKYIEYYLKKYGAIKIQELQKVIDNLQIDSTDFHKEGTFLIKCCGEAMCYYYPEKRVSIAHHVWEELKTKGLSFGIDHFNALLQVYVENNHEFSPGDFLERLQNEQVIPNAATYEYLVSYSCKNGNIDGALGFIHLMEEEGYPLTSSIHNSLILCHLKLRNDSKAEEMLSQMRREDLNEETCTYMLFAYAERGDVDLIKRTVLEFQSKIDISNNILLKVYHILASRDFNKEALQIIPLLTPEDFINVAQGKNIIKDLIFNKKCDAAFQLLIALQEYWKTLSSKPFRNKFFLKQMVVSQVAYKTIHKYTQEMLNHGFMLMPYEETLHFFLLAEDAASSLRVLADMKEASIPIREHYFWPLLCLCRKLQKREMVLEVVKKMTELKERISLLTLSYVTTALDPISVEEYEAALSPHLNHSALVSSLVGYLMDKDLKLALMHAEMHREDVFVLASKLSHQCFSTGDIATVVSFLKLIINNWDLGSKDEAKLRRPSKQPSAYVRKFIANCISYLERPLSDVTSVFEELLKSMKKEELYINFSDYKWILGAITPIQLEDTFEKLLKEIVDYSAAETDCTTEEEPSYQLDKLTHYIQKEKLQETASLLTELSDFGAIDPNVLDKALDLFSRFNWLPQASRVVELIEKTAPDFLISPTKLVQLAFKYVAVGNLEAALKTLKTNLLYSNNTRVCCHTTCEEVVKLLVSRGDFGGAIKIIETLLDLKYTVPPHTLYNFVIQGLLDKNDVAKALEAFKSCHDKYDNFATHNELFYFLVRDADLKGIKAVMELATLQQFENKLLHSFFFAYLQNDMDAEAKKIFKNIQPIPHLFLSLMKFYSEKGNSKVLQKIGFEYCENILNLSMVNLLVLKTHVKNKDVEGSLQNWVQMQDKNHPISDEYLTTLANFLRSQGSKVPFVVPPR